MTIGRLTVVGLLYVSCVALTGTSGADDPGGQGGGRSVSKEQELLADVADAFILAKLSPELAPDLMTRHLLEEQIRDRPKDHLKQDDKTGERTIRDLAERAVDQAIDAMCKHVDAARVREIKRRVREPAGGAPGAWAAAVDSIKAHAGEAEPLRRYREAREVIAAEQSKTAIAALARPTAAQVFDVVHRPAGRADLVKGMADVAASKADLFDEAVKHLRGAADELLRAAEEEYASQKRTLEGAPALRAHTPAGIAAELGAYLGAELDQKGKRAADRLLFALDDPILRDRLVAERFRTRLAAVIVAGGDAPVPTAAELAKAIEADVEKHARPAESVALFDRALEGAVRARVVEQYDRAAADAGSVDDKKSRASGSLRAAVEEHLGVEGAAKARFDALLSAARAGLKRNLADARATVTAAQSKRWAPNLAGEPAWWPAPGQVAARPDGAQLSREDLRQLKCWLAEAPADRQVLDEAWALWIEQAGHRTLVCSQVPGRQADLIKELSERFTPHDETAAEKGAAWWSEEFAKEATRRWREQKDDGALRYPDLLEASRQQILGLVETALKSEIAGAQVVLVNKHRAAARADVQGDVDAGRYPKLSDHKARYATRVLSEWKTHKLFPKYEGLHDQADARIVQVLAAMIDETVAAARADAAERAVKAAKAGDASGAMAQLAAGDRLAAPAGQAPGQAGAREKLDDRAVVLALQNRIVDRLAPGAVDRLSRELAAGATPTRAGAAAPLVRAVETAWQEQAKGAGIGERGLLREVRQRIDGIVVPLLTSVPDALAVAVKAQLDLVTKNAPTLRDQIASDYQKRKDVPAMKKDYRSRYQTLVSDDWKKNDLSKQPGLDGLLPSTEVQISGVLEELIRAESARAVKGPGGPGETKKDVATSPPVAPPERGVRLATAATPANDAAPRQPPATATTTTKAQTGVGTGTGTGGNGGGGGGGGTVAALPATTPAAPPRPTLPPPPSPGFMAAARAAVANNPGTFMLIFLVVVLILVTALLVLWGRTRGAWRDDSIFAMLGGRDQARGLVLQLRLALDVLRDFEPPPIRTLDDLTDALARITEEFARRWALVGESTASPHPRDETRFLLVGGLLSAMIARADPRLPTMELARPLG